MMTSEKQDAACEARYHNNKEVRERRMDALRSGNWNEVDDRKRIIQRVIYKGDPSLIAEVMADPASPVLERIIGDRELMPAAFFIEGVEKLRTVGRIRVRTPDGSGFGTGFMVSSRLLLTNNHVLRTESIASSSDVQFDFIEKLPGQLGLTIAFKFRPNDFFITDESLDFTLVAVEQVNDEGVAAESRGWNSLIPQSGKAIVGDRVNIVQHPNGRPMEVSVRQNRVVDIVGNFLHYSTDTQRGSSGSPVYNDLWDVAALHHASVPKRDAAGNRIGWEANEGVRISQILAYLDAAVERTSPTMRALYNGIKEKPPSGFQDDERLGSNGSPLSGAPAAYVSDRGDLIVPTQTYLATVYPDIKLARAPETPVSTKAPNDRAGVSAAAADIRRLAESFLEDFSARPYYDTTADLTESTAYYAEIDTSTGKRDMYRQLSALVQDTHATEIRYRTAKNRFLYPWIDLHETANAERELRSIYSGQPFQSLELLIQDLEIEFEVLGEELFSMNDDEVEERFDTLESSRPFNCEHVVPQSWFQKLEPMKGDLHHLFTCESGCNSFRGNYPYFEFPEEVTRERCGRREGVGDNKKFEPANGKGTVARATLYFLLRYPGKIGDTDQELQRNRLNTLEAWHQAEPPTDYERHRNAEIQRVQGNRNPLIDHPEWVSKISFRMGVG